ncbi:MAG: ParB/RepB/Spo0J family partition protein [Flavobacteriales bacterium]|nr:ParB/RepB/Spo0J family partition protein [Flavobacteriales bacterium]
MAKRNALGKGLGALLTDDENAAEGINELSPSSVAMIPLTNIVANPFQPRLEFEDESLTELAESILVHGVIQPITVRKVGYDKFELISGERRTRASIIAGLDKIPAYVRLANDQEMLEMALIENIQREDLNAIEISLSYKRLLDECGLKQEELGERVGKKRSTVNNYLRLLKLPEGIQRALQHNEISMGHARALITIEDEDVQLFIAKKIAAEDLSVRKVEDMVKQYQSTGSLDGVEVVSKNIGTKAQKATFKEFKPYRDLLVEKLDARIEFKATDGESGKLLIHFDDKHHLTDILEKLRHI